MNGLELPEGNGRIVACDTESSGLHLDDMAHGGRFRVSLSAVSLAWVGDEGEVVTRAYPFDQGRYQEKQTDGSRPTLFGDDGEGDGDVNLGWEEWVELTRWLACQRLTMQRGKHDLHQFRGGIRTYGMGVDLDKALWWDTQLASRVLEPRAGASLDAIGQRHLGMVKQRDELDGVIKASKGRYGTPTHPRLDLVPWRVIKPYAERDAEITLRACLWQMGEFEIDWGEVAEGLEFAVTKNTELWPHYVLDMAMLPILYRLEKAGVEFDKKAAYAAAEACQTKMHVLEVDLEFRPTPTEAAEWFFGKMKALPHCTTEKLGRPSVKECCVRELVTQPSVAAQAMLYQRWAKINSAVDKYYLGWAHMLGRDGKLRTDLDAAGTVSLRFSSKRVNLQAIPHEYRHETADLEDVVKPRYLLFPKEQMEAQGLVVAEFDLEQAELRGATSYAGCKLMRELLESGADAHGATAEMLFGDRSKEHRQIAKRGNFALIFQVGPKTFKEDLEKQIGLKISIERSTEIVGKWRGLYPEIVAANRKATRLAEQRGYVVLWDGRKRWFSDRELAFETSKAFNQVIQGGVAQICKAWMREVDAVHPGVLRLQVHDSLVCVLPKAYYPAMGESIQQMGEQIASKAFGIEMKVGVKPWRDEDPVKEPTAYMGRTVTGGKRG